MFKPSHEFQQMFLETRFSAMPFCFFGGGGFEGLGWGEVVPVPPES